MAGVAGTAPRDDFGSERIMLGLLESVERDGGQSQRRLAADLGVALGLVNAYLKRCVKKGFVKVGEAPARRYAYYLTPQGFAEKSRLTVEYLSSSFSLFRRARGDYAMLLDDVRARGFTLVILAGVSDLAEIATICALERDITIVGVVDGAAERDRFVGVPIFTSFADVKSGFEAVVITDFRTAGVTFREAESVVGRERVFAPTLLGFLPRQAENHS